MSAKAVNWAFSMIGQGGLAEADRLILIALAHKHNAKTGQCNPLVATIGEMTGLGRRRVFYGLRDLEAKGLIARHPMVGPKGKRATQFALGFDFETAPGGAYTCTSDGADVCTAKGAQKSTVAKMHQVHTAAHRKESNLEGGSKPCDGGATLAVGNAEKVVALFGNGGAQ